MHLEIRWFAIQYYTSMQSIKSIKSDIKYISANIYIIYRLYTVLYYIYLERKSVDDWVSACRGLVVEGTRGRGRSRKTWEQCVRDDMKLLSLHPEWAVFRDMWRDLIWGKRVTLA